MPSTFALRSLLVYEEPNGSFAVDHSGTPGDFVPVAFQPDSFSLGLDRPFIETNVAQQYKHGKSERVHGPRAATMAITVPLHGSGLQGSAAEANATASTNGLLRILKAVFGGLRGGNMGSTVASSPTSGSIFSVAAGHGSRFTAGGAMGWVNASGNLEIRPIESVSTDAIVLKYGFSTTPTAADALYNATTIYLDDGPSTTTSLQFIARGAAATDRWLLRGMQLQSIAINNPLGDLPTLALTFQGAEWSNIGSGSLAAVTYSDTEFLAFNGGALYVQPVGTATAASISASEITVTPNLSYTPVRGPGGTNTIFGYVQAHAPPVVSGSFKPHYDDQGYFDAWTNKTKQAVGLQIGMIESRGVLIEVANAQLGPVAAPQDQDGLTVQTVSYDGSLDTDATDQTTAIRRSPIRLHFVN